MPSKSFGGTVYTFTIDYTFDGTTFKITAVSSYASRGGWADWKLMPSFYMYIVNGNNSPDPSLQKTSGSAVFDWVAGFNGVTTNYKGNDPTELLSNSMGGLVTWSSDKLTNLSLRPSGTDVTVGTIIQNTTGTLNDIAFGHVYINDLYKSPSNLTITVSVETTTATVSANWTDGTADGRAYVKIGNGTEYIIDNDPVTFSGLTPNTTYTFNARLADNLNPGASFDTASKTATTNPVAPSGWASSGSNTNSIWATANSSNGGNFKYQYQIYKNGAWSGWQDSNTFSGLSSNTNYNIQARVVSNTTGITTGSIDGSVWTYPVVSALNVSLVSGQEHDAINANASIAVSSGNDSYRFRIDSNYTSWQGSNASWSGLTGNSTHTIGVTVRNNVSGLQSDEVTRTITTWYDPISSLSVNLVNRWFWYLSINCTVNYQGGIGNITKYEFDIGNQGYQNKGTTNAHSRGSTSSNGSDKLDYNTNYTCKVRVTDNHGRTKEASATFKTLDERPLYVDGILREVKLIKPDGSIHYITPNLLSVITNSGQVINMNKIINNDDRKEYS